MQSQSSMTSGLLNLSVHEALTFDGVEIALHPDLFAGTFGGIQGRHSRDTSFASSITAQGRHTRDASFSSLGGVSGRNGHMVVSSSPLIPSTSSLSMPTQNPTEFSSKLASITPNNNEGAHDEHLPDQSRTTLQPGDLIELRVWDASPNRQSLSRDSQTTDIPTDYINTTVNHSLSQEHGKTIVLASSRETQKVNDQRRQGERLSFTSTKPPVAPRSISGTSSIGASTKVPVSHLSKSPSPPSNITATTPGLTSLPPSKPPNFLIPFRGNDQKDSPKHPPKKHNTHELPPSLSSDPNPPSLSSSLSEEEVLSSSKKVSNSVTVLSSDSTSQNGRLSKKEPMKSESAPTSRMSSLDSSCSNTFAVALQNTDDYQLPSQRVPDVLDIIMKTHNLRLMIVMVVTDKSLTALKNNSRIQVSLLRQVADLFDLSSYETKITVTKVEKSKEAAVLDSAQVDFVTVTIKDQFISRGEMYQFSHNLVGSWIYAGERLVTDDGVRGNVMELRSKISSRSVKSGLVTIDTNITFRSCSARIIWLVQISSEMWDYAPPYVAGRSQGVSAPNGDRGCEIYFDRFVSFMYRLFDKWKELEVTHSLTVVFFSRTLISNKSRTHTNDGPQHEHLYHESTIQKDSDGRLYEDHIKVVVQDETKQGNDWHSLVLKIKRAFVSYPSEVGWDLSTDLYRVPSTAAQGNILEAINTALNMLQLHYMDRDLRRSGNSVVVVSAGSGVFEVEKWLAGITKQRMMDNGIGSDMLSLGLPPLHVAPFFLYKEGSNPPTKKMHGFDGWKTYFEIPHWMHLSFISYDRPGRTSEANVEKRADDCSIKVEKQQSISPQINVVANSFLIRQATQNDLVFTGQAQLPTNTTNKQSRHLISGRDFEDILEACRPRRVGESSTRGVPSALYYRLKLIDQVNSRDVKNSVRIENEKNDSIHGKRGSYEIQHIFSSSLEEDKCPVMEWGSALFDEINGMTMVPKSIPTISESGPYAKSPSHKIYDQIAASFNSDKSSPSSGSNFVSLQGHSFGSNNHMASPASNGIQIQQSTSFDIPLFTFGNGTGPLKTTTSTDSLSTMGNDDIPNSFKTCDIMSSSITKKMTKIESLHNTMINYDNNVFAPIPKNIRDLHNDKSCASVAGREDSVGVIVPTHSNSHQTSGGIGAALVQFNSGQSLQEPGTAIKKRTMHTVTSSNVRFFKPMYSRAHPFVLSGEHNKKHEAVDGLRQRNVHLLSPYSAHETLQQKVAPVHSSDSIRMNIHKKQVTGILNTRPELSKKPARSPERDTMASGHKYDRSKYVKKGEHLRKNNALHSSTKASKSKHSKAWVLNPFRQEDEEEVLAERTHNSRRWSHVFPKGEIEFKRHAGPNWNSLCQPAILPVTIDVSISPKELNDPRKYSSNPYNLILDAVDLTQYKSHSDLLKEMVKQRLIQDFQLVPESILLEKKRRVDRIEKYVQHSVHSKSDSVSSTRSMLMQNSHLPQRSPTMPKTKEKHKIQYTLTMGHKFQVLSCDPTSGTVGVVEHNAKLSNNERAESRYNYMLWSSTSCTYARMSQNFQQYPKPYAWNMIDGIICGERPKKLSERTRYRNLSYRLIPDKFDDLAGEEEFIKRIKRLLELIEKMVKQPCGIQIISSINRQPESHTDQFTKRKFHPEKSFYVPLDKGKRDKCEWMEIVIDSTVDTRRTFRINIHWLLACSVKVEAQVQLLTRRCVQYGLHLVQFSYVSISSNIHLHAFLRPETIEVKDVKQAKYVEASLLDTFEYIDDFKPLVNAQDLNVAFGFKPTIGLWTRSVAVPQYVHQSGTNFIRLLQNNSGSTLFIFVENRKHTSSNSDLSEVARDVFHKVSNFIQNVLKSGSK